MHGPVRSTKYISACSRAPLEVAHISRRFGGVCAVDDVSFAPGPSKVTALIGPNGAGKTTLLNIISGALRPDSGEVRIYGRDLTASAANVVVRAGLARTFQDMRLFDHLTVLENVIVGQLVRVRRGIIPTLFQARRSRSKWAELCVAAEEVLETVGLSAHRTKLPPELSYGMCRRLDIARAVATGARILLLDEPASGVRAQEISLLEGLVCRLADEGTTVLLVEHNMRFVKAIAEDAIVLNFGRKIAEGPCASVLEQDDVVDSYLGAKRRGSDNGGAFG